MSALEGLPAGIVYIKITVTKQLQPLFIMMV